MTLLPGDDLLAEYHSLDGAVDEMVAADGTVRPHWADVAATHAALEAAGLTVVADMHERIVVHDQLRIAGTFDVLVTDGTETFVADFKTGNLYSESASFTSRPIAVFAILRLITNARRTSGR